MQHEWDIDYRPTRAQKARWEKVVDVTPSRPKWTLDSWVWGKLRGPGPLLGKINLALLYLLWAAIVFGIIGALTFFATVLVLRT